MTRIRRVSTLRFAIGLTSLFPFTVFAGENLHEKLGVPPSQDLAMMRKAWQCRVKMDYKRKTMAEILADLAKQSGIPIRAELNMPEVRPERMWRVSGGFNSQLDKLGYRVRQRTRVLHFLGETGLQALKETWIRGREANAGYLRLTTDGPVPLILALESALHRTHDYSMRKDHIRVASHKELRPEMLVTIRVKMKHTWGSIFKYTLNGKPVTHRLSLLDTIAREFRRHPRDRAERSWGDIDPNGRSPAGANDRLKAIGDELGATLDEGTGMLSITAHYRFLDTLDEERIRRFDRPSPEEQTREADAFRTERLRALSDAAWKKLSGAERDRLKALAGNLGHERYERRVAADAELLAAGLPGAWPLLRGDPSGAEERNRRSRICDAVYRSSEIDALLRFSRAYLAAGAAGRVTKVYNRFWGVGRRQQFDQARQAFDEERANALRDQSLWPVFERRYRNRASEKVRVKDLTYRDVVADRMRVEAPRVEQLTVSGRHASVTFSVVMEQEEHDTGERRFGSQFSATLQNGRWVAGVARIAIEDPQPLTWKRQAKPPVTGGATNIVAGGMVGAGAWEIATNFGY